MNVLVCVARQEQFIGGYIYLCDELIVFKKAKEWIFVLIYWQTAKLFHGGGHPQTIEKNLDTIIEISTVLDKAARFVPSEEENIKGTTQTPLLVHDWNEASTTACIIISKAFNFRTSIILQFSAHKRFRKVGMLSP